MCSVPAAETRRNQGGGIDAFSTNGVGDSDGGGHHRKAITSFAWPVPKPKILELIVEDVAGVSERMFSWTVK